MSHLSRSWGSGSNYGSLVKDSVSTPGFRMLKKLGLPLPQNDYSSIYQSWNSDVVNTYNGLRSQWSAWPHPDPEYVLGGGLVYKYASQLQVLGKGYDYLLKEARNELSKKLRSTDIDLSVALGEASETAHLLVSNANKLANTLICLKKKDFGGAARHLFGSSHSGPSPQKSWLRPTDPAKIWLEYQYGVAPLMKDIEGAVKQLGNADNKPEKIDIKVYRTSILDMNAFDRFSSTYTKSEMISAVASVHGRFTAVVQNPFANTLSSLGLTNPVATAWELVPFSFVLDKFYDVGSALNSLVPVLGLESCLQVYTYGGNMSYQANCDDKGWHTAGNGNCTIRKRLIVPGQPSFSIPPTLCVPSPGFIPNALALLQTAASDFFQQDWSPTKHRSR